MQSPDLDENLLPGSELSPQGLFANLSVGKLIFHLRPERSISPYFYFGSTWRGVLGWEMKKLICPFSKPQCSTCCIQSNCPYFGLFEHQVSLPGIQDAPRGYVLYPSLDDAHGDVRLSVTLIGHCTAYLPVVIESISRAARRGVGREGLRFTLLDIQAEKPLPGDTTATATNGSRPEGVWSLSQWLDNAQDPEGPVRIYLPTPLRLRRQGRYLDRLEWPFFFQSLARRLEGLDCIFGQGRPMGSAAWKELADHFVRLSPPTVTQDRPGNSDSRTDWLKWKDLKRYSNRQKKKVPLGGLVGRVMIPELDPWLYSWLKAAELIHVGKNASMGLGRLEVEGVAHA